MLHIFGQCLIVRPVSLITYRVFSVMTIQRNDYRLNKGQAKQALNIIKAAKQAGFNVNVITRNTHIIIEVR